LFTNYPVDEFDKVYPADLLPNLKLVHTLTGFVPEHLCERKVLPFGARTVDVGYRSRRVPAWLGELGQDKWRIGPRFLDDAPRYGLVCDISNSEEDRLYGEKWIAFVAGCKAVLGTESGASVVDFDGNVRARVDTHLRRQPNVTFEELQRLYFTDLEHKIRINVISPRCFEAAALRTLMIMYPGEYTGILTADRHYIRLAKDHSNMDEVAAALRDKGRCEEIIQTAFDEIACNPEYTFRTFVGRFDDQILEGWASKGLMAAQAYAAAELASDSRLDLTTRWRRWEDRRKVALYRLFFGKILSFLSPERRHRVKRALGNGLARAKSVLRPTGAS